jgi:hypothetical protein
LKTSRLDEVIHRVEYFRKEGRMTRLSTWQDFAAQSGRADTLWTYDTRRGFLAAKTYADSNVSVRPTT